MKSGTLEVRSLYRSGSVTTVARDLARYKLDLVGVQKFKWDKGGMVRAGITFVDVIILRSSLCNIIVLKVLAQRE